MTGPRVLFIAVSIYESRPTPHNPNRRPIPHNEVVPHNTGIEKSGNKVAALYAVTHLDGTVALYATGQPRNNEPPAHQVS